MKLNRRDFIKTAGGFTAAAAAVIFLPDVTFSATGDKVEIAASGILRPTFVAPHISLPTAPVSYTLREGTQLAKAWLADSAGRVIDLKVEQANGASMLLPASTPDPGLYSLYTEISRGDKSRVEMQPNAVSFVGSFKSSFTFAVISDVHFGDPRLASKRMDYKVVDMVRKEVAMINDRGIEFCLCCGDLCFIPPKSKNELMEYAETIVGAARFPTFTVPGNHDGYASGAGASGKITFDTAKFYDKSFGSQNYSARYGDVAIVGMNTFDKAPEERNLYGGLGDKVDGGALSGEQLAWIDGELGKATKDAKSTILIGHHNPTNTVVDVNGPFEVRPFSEVGRKEILDLIKKHKPNVFFNGHVHGYHQEKLGDTDIVTAPTAGSMPAEGQALGFLFVEVKDGKPVSWERVETLNL